MKSLVNREIKFRGIPLFGKEFVYGSLIIDTDEKGEKVYVIRRIESGKVSNFEVKEETVGQSIGLQDKNLEDIYEGDIARIEKCFTNGIDTLSDHIGQIKYSNCRFMIIDEFFNSLCPYEYKNQIEVIGNISKIQNF